MPKVLKTISNIFSRNRSSRLESDATPVPDNNANITENGENCDNESTSSRDPSPSSGGNVSSPSSCQDLALITQNNLLNRQQQQRQVVPTSFDLYNANVVNTNNVLAVNNTQGQVVYQFSHIKGLHMGSVYHINSGEEGNSKEKQRRRKTKTVAAMIRSNEQLSHKMLDCISTHLGEGWQNVMRELGYSEGQIHQAKVDYFIDGGLKEVIYQLLLDWTRNDDSATLGKISQILWRGAHFETVDYMKESWKAAQAQNDVEVKESWKAEKNTNPQPKDDIEVK